MVLQAENYGFGRQKLWFWKTPSTETGRNLHGCALREYCFYLMRLEVVVEAEAEVGVVYTNTEVATATALVAILRITKNTGLCYYRELIVDAVADTWTKCNGEIVATVVVPSSVVGTKLSEELQGTSLAEVVTTIETDAES